MHEREEERAYPNTTALIAEVFRLYITDRGFGKYRTTTQSPLLTCSVSLCSVRSVGPLNRTSLHSPTQGAGGRETLVFLSFSYVRNVLLLVLVHQLVEAHVG